MAPNAYSNPFPNLDGNDDEDLLQFLDDEDNISTMTEEESLLEDMENYYNDAVFEEGREQPNLVPNDMSFPCCDHVKKQPLVQVPQSKPLSEHPSFDIVMDVNEPNERAATSMDFFVEFNDLFCNLDELDEDFSDGAVDMDF